MSHHKGDWCPLCSVRWVVDAAYTWPHTGHVGRDVEEICSHVVHCWTLHSQRFMCLVFTVNKNIQMFPLSWRAEGLASWKVWVSYLEWLEQVNRFGFGSEEVCGGGEVGGSGLSMGPQKVNYVLVGGSLRHQLCCLSILWKNREKMSQHHFKDTAVTALIQTVAVLCFPNSASWTLQ